MKSKINMKLLFFVFALLFLTLAIITIQATYARYVTSLTAGGSVELGSWLIKVNDQNIMENSDLSNKIVPIFNKASENDEFSEYIAEGKLAPTSIGYVVITLDYSKVTVPFKYDISFSAVPSTTPTFLEDFIFTSYSIDDGEEVTVDDSTVPITDTISPDDATRTRALKLNFAWFDGNGESFDDALDTSFSRNNDDLGMRFNLSFTQLQPTL